MPLDMHAKAAITELLHRYCHNADYNPPERMRELFTPDGIFEIPAMELHFEGIDAIVAFFTASRAASTSGARHVISNVLIEGDADRATSSAYLQVLGDRDGVMGLVAFGRYLDKLQRGSDGNWRFTHRHVVLG